MFLKQRWNVSIAFLIRRALDVGAVSYEQRRCLEIELSTQPGGRTREPAEFEVEEPSLVRTMIEALESAGMSKVQIADLAGMTERRLRTVYLREKGHLRPIEGGHRVVVELPPAL